VKIGNSIPESNPKTHLELLTKFLYILDIIEIDSPSELEYLPEARDILKQRESKLLTSTDIYNIFVNWFSSDIAPPIDNCQYQEIVDFLEKMLKNNE
jgi:hypothetical protein